MTFDDLRSSWQETNGESLSAEQREEIVARVCRRVERLGASILRRDVIETVAAVAVIFFFSGFFLRSDIPVAKTGAAIVVASAVFIIYKLHRTRLVQKPTPLDASVRQFCKTEMERLDRQIRLGRSVLWWYIIPPLVGVNLLFSGVAGFGTAAEVYLIVTVLFGWGVYLLNQHAVSKSLVPARDELSDLFDEMSGKKRAKENSN